MADKAISELVSAEQITATDMFVLEQNGTAKKLTGQVLLNWLTAAADGHGGIQSSVLLKTEGLVKTYRFTYADQTYTDIPVMDGKGVTSVAPISTEGLVVTYRISYNDGTYDTFSITNGEKGDKGDNADIWVRYASQEPTENSHSFGEVPDAWIGISSGHLASAPTDWKQYRWYKWKGEKGDTGAPATLLSAEVTYQAGTSGTVIPSGSWSESIPTVAQGQFLWTRIVQQFNTGSPVTAYAVSRMGLDGLGAIVTVNNVSPDGNGNVAIDADSVKALSINGGTMQGSINMNGQSLSGLNAPTASSEAATKGYVDTAISKFDVSSQVTGKVDKTSVVNNFTTTEAGFVADARALKTLNDKISSAWEYLGTTKGTTPLTVSEGYRMACLSVKIPRGNIFSCILPVRPSDTVRNDMGFYITATSCGFVNVSSGADGKVSIISAFQSGENNVTADSTMSVFGLK